MDRMRIQLDPERFQAVVTVDDRLLTVYRYGHYASKPFFYPLLTPQGQRLTRGFPVERIEGETQDHPHHRSLFVSHGDVNGVDLWSEGIGHGVQLQRGDPAVALRDGAATLDGMIDWFGPEGRRLLEERRSVTLRAEGDLRILDHCSAFRAAYGEVAFGDTKEGGLLALRVATSMDAKGRGRIENANGQVFENGQGEEITWGQRAAWVDYSGPLSDGCEGGLTVVDHPANPRHPTYWHVRGYGLFTANPFGVRAFTQDSGQDGRFVIPAGESAVFNYRLIVHPGRGIGHDAALKTLIDAFGR